MMQYCCVYQVTPYTCRYQHEFDTPLSAKAAFTSAATYVHFISSVPLEPDPEFKSRNRAVFWANCEDLVMSKALEAERDATLGFVRLWQC